MYKSSAFHGSFVMSHWLFVIGHLLLVTRHRSLGIGHLVIVVRQNQKNRIFSQKGKHD